VALRFDILTLFPELFETFAETSIVGRAQTNGLVDIQATNFRDFAKDRYQSVDDAPYGGGVGMVLMCGPITDAVNHVRTEGPKGKVILMTPQGEPMNQALLDELKSEERLILIAGHYEGFDERIRESVVDREVSLGDFVLSGGEIAAMALVDGITRLLPGALGKDESTHEESHQAGLLEYPHYTRPRVFEGLEVPEVLLNGHHAKIEAWRQEQSIERTKQRRPDLYEAWLANHKECQPD
jgi:tRNA (guanine37-N1)-methyltransferase